MTRLILTQVHHRGFDRVALLDRLARNLRDHLGRPVQLSTDHKTTAILHTTAPADRLQAAADLWCPGHAITWEVAA